MKEKVENFLVNVGFIFCLACIVYTLQSFAEDKADGYLFWNNIIVCGYPGTCFHELGHIKNDQLDNPSNSPKFKKAIDEYLEWCIGGKRFWPTECEHLETFPGINGNELARGFWGGYEELYADLFMYQTWHNLLVPDNVKIFFDIHWRER